MGAEGLKGMDGTAAKINTRRCSWASGRISFDFSTRPWWQPRICLIHGNKSHGKPRSIFLSLKPDLKKGWKKYYPCHVNNFWGNCCPVHGNTGGFGYKLLVGPSVSHRRQSDLTRSLVLFHQCLSQETVRSHGSPVPLHPIHFHFLVCKIFSPTPFHIQLELNSHLLVKRLLNRLLL